MGVAPGVSPDDLARVVDGKRPGVGAGGQGIVDRGEGAAAQQEAMGAAGVVELADDLAHVVDVEGQRSPGAGSRIVDGGEDVDWHGRLSWPHTVLVSAPSRYSEVVRLSAPTSDANESFDQGEHAYSWTNAFLVAASCVAASLRMPLPIVGPLSCVLAAECLPDTLQRHLSLPHSSSASRFTAGASAFFILSQSGERPER